MGIKTTTYTTRYNLGDYWTCFDFINLGLQNNEFNYKKSLKMNNTDEISTVNIALEEYLSSFRVYIVKHYYFTYGHENVIKEKIYNTGTNNERLERAEKFYKLICQNISTHHLMGTDPVEHKSSVSLSFIEKQNDIEKVTVLKKTDNKILRDRL